MAKPNWKLLPLEHFPENWLLNLGVAHISVGPLPSRCHEWQGCPLGMPRGWGYTIWVSPRPNNVPSVVLCDSWRYGIYCATEQSAKDESIQHLRDWLGDLTEHLRG